MKKPIWIAVGTLFLLGGCAQKNDGDERAVNGTALSVPANAAVQALVPILHNEGDATVLAQASASPIAPTATPPRRMHIANAAIEYRGLGTEPFWSVTVHQGRATLQRPDRSPLTVAVTQTQDPRALRFVGEGLTMVVTPGPCSDGMSDAVYADRVQVAFGEGTFKGCGGPRVDDGPERP